MNIQDVVVELIGKQKEGQYWDFKREHHTNNAMLLHDLLCLANADHDGDRFLIFGVDDQSHQITQMAGKRKNQADIIDFFRSIRKRFSRQIVPEIELTTMSLNQGEIDVIHISNTNEKPYFLVENYDDKGKTVKANHIYTRRGDTNTPMTESADHFEIKRMWCEQLGLLPSPIARFKKLLQSDTQFWKSWQNGIYHHTDAPEFTISFDNDDNIAECHTLEWARGEVGHHLDSGNFTSTVSLYYFSTVLYQAFYVSFDGGKKKIIAPDFLPFRQGRFYYYLDSSIEADLQGYIARSHGQDDSININSPIGRNLLSIPRLTETQLSDFSKMIDDEANMIEPETNLNEQNKIFDNAFQVYVKFVQNK